MVRVLRQEVERFEEAMGELCQTSARASVLMHACARGAIESRDTVFVIESISFEFARHPRPSQVENLIKAEPRVERFEVLIEVSSR